MSSISFYHPFFCSFSCVKGNKKCQKEAPISLPRLFLRATKDTVCKTWHKWQKWARWQNQQKWQKWQKWQIWQNRNFKKRVDDISMVRTKNIFHLTCVELPPYSYLICCWHWQFFVFTQCNLLLGMRACKVKNDGYATYWQFIETLVIFSENFLTVH